MRLNVIVLLWFQRELCYWFLSYWCDAKFSWDWFVRLFVPQRLLIFNFWFENNFFFNANTIPKLESLLCLFHVTWWWWWWWWLLLWLDYFLAINTVLITRIHRRRRRSRNLIISWPNTLENVFSTKKNTENFD